MTETETSREKNKGRIPRWVLAVLYTAIAVIVWKLPSKAIQDIILGAAFIYSIIHLKRGLPFWKNPAGYAFTAIALYSVVSIAVSVNAGKSISDTMKFMDAIATVFSITVIFNNRRKIESAMLYSATALTLILAYDLVWLVREYGKEVMKYGHVAEPFILNHSNVASMAAGAAFITLIYFTWKWRRTPAIWIPCSAGLLINLVYQIVVASRGPQVAFAATIFLAGAVIFPKPRTKAAWIILMAIAGALVVANIGRINPRFLDKFSMRGFCDRDKVWSHAWELTKDRPVLGHGLGKETFKEVYHGSNPPESPFYFNHTHQYWLFILFQQGWIGVILYAVAWVLLLVRLLRSVALSKDMEEERLLPALATLLIMFILLYGMGDLPDHVVRMMLIWLIGAALVITGDQSLSARTSTSE